MALNEEEKQKITEEEKFRSQVKDEQKAKAEKQKKKESNRKALGCLAIIIIVAIFIIGSAALNDDNDSTTSSGISQLSSPQVEDQPTMAFVIAKDFVQQYLKSPSTADFPLLDFTSTHLDDNRYEIISYVDAQNSFGAEIRSNWQATTQYNGGESADPNNWILVELIINDQILYPTE